MPAASPEVDAAGSFEALANAVVADVASQPAFLLAATAAIPVMDTVASKSGV